MSVETFNLTETISVTDAAARHFAGQLESSGARGVRLSLKESGCSGYMYTLDEVDEPFERDISMTLDNGVVLCFDPAHAVALRGTEIDYTKEGLNYRLRIENPNAVDACGCGESFNFDQQA
ncbi:MAG: iron-sulfur cluster assembly accessory protein [Gammaproteobacteria bacterium]|nr:iron-sulfur cluster assembly accessory protein [Gammaproteobacteria bacterium]